MIRLGATLMFFGFISALLHFTDVQLRLLIWSEPMQPVLGLAIGAVGVVVLAIPLMFKKDQAPQAGGQQFAPQPGYQPQTGPNSGPMPMMAPQQQMPPQGYQQPQGRPMPQPQGGPGFQGGPGPQRPMPQPQGYPQQQPGYGAPQGGYGPQGGFGPQG